MGRRNCILGRKKEAILWINKNPDSISDMPHGPRHHIGTSLGSSEFNRLLARFCCFNFNIFY